MLSRLCYLVCILCLWVPSVSAGTLYRCVGADEVPQFTEKKIPGMQCRTAATFTNAVSNSDPKTTPVITPVKNVESGEGVENKQSASSNESLVSSSNANKEVKFLRMGYSTTYTWLDADDVRHFASSKPQGVANVVTKRTEYPIFSIPTCYACGLTSSVNFSNVKLNLTAYANEVRLSAKKYSVDEAIVRAIIHAESAFRPHVVSPKNAQGLMQLIPGTAKRFGVRDAFDPAQNIEGGVQYLAFLQKRYKNNLTLIAAAYNAGEGAVDKYNGVPPYKETKNYVVRVGQLAERYRKAL